MSLTRLLRRNLGSLPVKSNPQPFHRQRQAFESASILVSVFYATQFFFVSGLFSKWVDWRKLEMMEPLWPVRWVPLLGIPLSVDFIVTLYTLGLGLALLYPHHRLCRLLAFLGLFFYVAFENSFGRISHAFHAWLYVAFIFIFLPDGQAGLFRRDRLKRQKYLTVFLAAQAMILMIYSIAGFWKVLGAGLQTAMGELSALDITGFANQIAGRLLETGTKSRLGLFLIDHPWLGYLLLLAGIYFELFALLAVFRPPLQRFWGLVLISLHLGSNAIFTVGFSHSILLLGVMLLCSPYHPKPFRLQDMVLNLPLLHTLTKIMNTGHRNLPPAPLPLGDQTIA